MVQPGQLSIEGKKCLEHQLLRMSVDNETKSAKLRIRKDSLLKPVAFFKSTVLKSKITSLIVMVDRYNFALKVQM